VIRDKAPQLTVFLLAHGLFQGKWPLRHLEHPLHLLGGQPQLFGDLFRRRLTSPILLQLLGDLIYLPNPVAQMHGQPNDAALIGQSTRDGLADPPCGIGAKAMAAMIVELFDGLDQAQIALLNEIQEGHTLPQVTLGDAHHQARVGANHVRPRCLSALNKAIQLVLFLLSELAGIACQPGPSLAPDLIVPREADLLLRGQQRNASHLLEIEADRVVTGDLTQR